MAVSSVQAQQQGSVASMDQDHLVQSGETLDAIAAVYGVSPQALMGANAQLLHPDLLQPGQSISIPAANADSLLGDIAGAAGLGGLAGGFTGLAGGLVGEAGSTVSSLTQDVAALTSTLVGDLTSLFGAVAGLTGEAGSGAGSAMGAVASAVSNTAQAATGALQQAGDYTVQAGDTLSGIGQRLGVDWHVLAQLNHLGDPNLILPGEQLVLPGGAGKGVATGGAAPTTSAPAAGGDGGNAARIAESYLNQNASSLMASHALPMDPNCPDTESCANFVSAVLIKAGELPASDHTDLVSTLDSTLRARGWTPVDAADAKPGDVVIMQGGGIDHTEMVSGPGQMIGSNNVNPDGSQRISYDSLSYAASHGGVILQPPEGVGAPAAGQTQASAPTTGATGGGDKVQQAVSYFESQGWTHAQAAGIVANLQTESRLSTTAVGDGGTAYGLAQWHPDRQATFDQAFGHPIQGSSFGQQLAFVQYELTHTESSAGQRLHAAGNAGEAGSVVSRYYERPADADGQASARATTANQIYAETH